MDTYSLNELEQKKFALIDGQISVRAFICNQDFATNSSIVEVKESVLSSNVLLSSIESGIIESNTVLDTIYAKINGVAKQEDTLHNDGDYGIHILGVRNDNDISNAANGEYASLSVDEQGRLKVSSKPASYSDIVGDIVAIQSTISTPVVGGTVTGDVSRASNVMMFCTGTFAGINCSFEGSLESSGDTNWFSVQAVRSNANTIETATGVLAAQPVYAWELSVNGLKRVRVRCTARTSGTQSWRFVLGTYATEPIPAAQTSATQAISGTVTTTPGTPSTATGISAHTPIVCTASINATLIKTGATVIGSISISNTGTSWRFLKIFDKATTVPAPATDSLAIKRIIGIPPGQSKDIDFSTPLRMALGFGICVTAGMALTDATVIAADTTVSFSYV